MKKRHILRILFLFLNTLLIAENYQLIHERCWKDLEDDDSDTDTGVSIIIEVARRFE